MTAPYEVGRLFVARLAGVPFDVLQQITTSAASQSARDVLVLDTRLVDAAALASSEIDGVIDLLTPRMKKRLRRDLRELLVEADLFTETRRVSGHALPALAAYAALAHDRAAAWDALEHQLRDGYVRAARQIIDSALAHLPEYAVFASDDLAEQLTRLAQQDSRDPFQSKTRNAVEHLALYLQRVCAKTDTISRFGPSAWGAIDDGSGFRIQPVPGITQRRAFLERWVATAVLLAMNADADVRTELAPRVHPDGRIEEASFVRLDTDQVLPCSGPELALLARCDGVTPARVLGDLTTLEALAARGVVIWRVEPIAFDTRPVETLLEDVRRWRASDVRTRWEPLLEQLVAAAGEVERTEELAARRAAIDRVRQLVQSVGATLPQRTRKLYSAFNPIVEECARECNLVVGRRHFEQFERDARPWLDLWMDTYSLAAASAFAPLVELYRTAPRRDGEVSLPAFLGHCERGGRNLRAAALAAIGNEAFATVKADMRDVLSTRSDAEEWELTADDCHVVRKRHSFPFVDELSWPSADVQISARSADDVAGGDFQWIISELHVGTALFQNCFFWACPEQQWIGQFAERLRAGNPWLVHSHAVFGGGVHTTMDSAVDLMDARFVASERGKPGWRTVAPRDAVIYVDDAKLDIRVRHRETQEDLGSLTRAMFLGMGFHPFFPVAFTPHTPRLRLGNVIVQRQTWYVTHEELRGGPFQGVSRDLVLAIERLRATRNLPRWVYIRPSASVLQRSDFLARDKDLKPIYVDFESYVFAEIFAQRLAKYGELEVIEMLPDPEHMVWREPDGARAFELRTLVFSARSPR